MAKIESVEVRWLDLRLKRPYRLSYRTFETFEPFMVTITTDDGASAFADGHISPGSSEETREAGWQRINGWAAAAVGSKPGDAHAAILPEFPRSKVAATAILTALELLKDPTMVDITAPCRLPLLAPVNETEADAIRDEIAAGVQAGFATFKVKVGKDVEADLARVKIIQAAARGRATLRLDANRAFGRDDAVRFARQLSPEGIELFEQPCHADDWDANAAVAAASPVPLMLDEPICSLEDIERAGSIPGVGFCKLKLKRFGGLERLRTALEAVREHGMEPVMGDGLGSEIHSWLEAGVARTTIRNAGEFNGFLKPRDRLFANPLPFEAGAIVLEPGYRPRLDPAALAAATAETLTHT